MKQFGLLILRSAIKWIPFAIVVTVCTSVAYLAVQQNIRLSANIPQVETAENVAKALESGADPAGLNDANKVDVATNLALFIIAMDDAGAVTGSTANLNGESPKPPQGALEYTKTHGQNRITWEPQKGVRLAIVIEHVSGDKGGYVVAGRSLRETENLINTIMIILALAWGAGLIATLIAVIISQWLLNLALRSPRAIPSPKALSH